METERAIEVANIIRKQIGGRAFMMLGAKDLIGLTEGEGGLQFRIRGSRAVNKVRVILEPSDTYKVQFFKVHGIKCKAVAEHEGVYVDMLHALIEKETGLYTSL